MTEDIVPNRMVRMSNRVKEGDVLLKLLLDLPKLKASSTIGTIKGSEEKSGLMAMKRVLQAGISVGSKVAIHHTRRDIVVDTTNKAELMMKTSDHLVRDSLGYLLVGGTIGAEHPK